MDSTINTEHNSAISQEMEQEKPMVVGRRILSSRHVPNVYVLCKESQHLPNPIRQ